MYMEIKMIDSKVLELANNSGGTLYLMAILLLVALSVIIDRSRYILNMHTLGVEIISLLIDDIHLNSPLAHEKLKKYGDSPHIRVIESIKNIDVSRNVEKAANHLEASIMHEVPMLDRSLWMLDTVITIAPLLGLFGTIIGMFNAFSVLDDVQNNIGQVTGGIAEALISTACGIFIAMLGVFFFNWLTNRVKLIVHQLETLKVMLLSR